MALFEVLLPDTPLTDVLHRVVQLAARTVGDDHTSAAIALSQEATLRTPVHTDERAPRIDAVQYEEDAGPTVEAYRRGEVVIIDDTLSEQRWPAFARAAAAEQIRSTLSVPLDVSGSRSEMLGVLNLYSEKPGRFDDEAVVAIQSFAKQAAIVLANAQAYWGAKALGEQLQAALESRGVIDQAKGILMGREHIDADRAFSVLVRASQRENRKLRDIALEIVDHVVRRD